MYRYLIALFLGITLEVSCKAEESSKTIFCTNNLDGTGECYSEKDNTPIKCLAIPGQVIRCKESSGIQYLCVQFEGQFFSCNKINNEDEKNSTLDLDIIKNGINGPIGPARTVRQSDASVNKIVLSPNEW